MRTYNTSYKYTIRNIGKKKIPAYRAQIFWHQATIFADSLKELKGLVAEAIEYDIGKRARKITQRLKKVTR